MARIPNEKIYVDSVSLELALRLFGIRKARRPGVQEFYELEKEGCAYLIASEKHKPSFPTCYVLPEQLKSPMLSDDLMGFLQGLPAKQLLVIGISSPTQNDLAREIEMKFPDKFEIYCLGAAIYQDILPRRNYWLVFLFASPVRTLKKIGITVREFLSVLISHRTRRAFLSSAQEFEN